jgi:hypothetical protein
MTRSLPDRHVTRVLRSIDKVAGGGERVLLLAGLPQDVVLKSSVTTKEATFASGR